MRNNPILNSDFPDPDIIRVGDTYYMISTTMHFMPGGVILKSYDLINWEIESYVFSELDNTAAQRLEDDKNIYGKGMWAASLRYNKGTYYVCFVVNDTRKTYLYKSNDIHGPWQKQNIEGFYHDNSLLFDDDGKVYIVYGNTEIYITELNEELTAPKKGGLHRLLIKEKENVCLGYEGSHIYKINGIYYIFLIHWLAGDVNRRVEACFYSTSLEGEFVGGDVLNDDMKYHNQGVAQGGIVDTPDGEFYAVLFQDSGAVGRIPVVVPVKFAGKQPVFGLEGKVPKEIKIRSTKPDYKYKSIVDSDDFKYIADDNGKFKLKDIWQWNHTPNNSLWTIIEKEDKLRIATDKIVSNITQAANILTQRMVYPSCEAIVIVDGSGLKNGDYTGIAAFQGCYGYIALKKENDKYYLVMASKEDKRSKYFNNKYNCKNEIQFEKILVNKKIFKLKIIANFENMMDEASFYYEEKGRWEKLGITHKLYFNLDHFTGCRFGLFIYSTKEIGGYSEFSKFNYRVLNNVLKKGL